MDSTWVAVCLLCPRPMVHWRTTPLSLVIYKTSPLLLSPLPPGRRSQLQATSNHMYRYEGGKEGGRDGGREGGTKGGREGGVHACVRVCVIQHFRYMYVHMCVTVHTSICNTCSLILSLCGKFPKEVFHHVMLAITSRPFY